MSLEVRTGNRWVNLNSEMVTPMVGDYSRTGLRMGLRVDSRMGSRVDSRMDLRVGSRMGLRVVHYWALMEA